ncbi:TIGR03885 family FMN-dependent LLM class oxidoreductase [Jiangella mangrovi]|uniref:Putative non-F420 flavinoid oxidoreductase n=1 Tax=Jiangella mangrovi TaxID=1524084 RepID=A0A7W9GSL3_9ACTN|nr:TIGR03885 family FMN-dependent LLM class oxidoreductase [Jiangella mangrovi]MBB5789300.1 putative non-F420 flavinoid oxidoreductase [Jiangella mangrovi]
MPVVGWHASHEQIPPSRLLADVRQAEQAGFQAVWSSDHLAPWSARQGESGFSFAWLGAAMATTNLPFGVVCAPGQRYHPVVAAQAVATLEEMFPGRFAVALGSGENLNEHVTGEPWPDKPTRNARLRECVDIMRALLDGDEVTHRGLVTVDRARLWTRPPTPPPLYATAVSPETAGWAAEWADGLVTVGQPTATLERVVHDFRANGGVGKPLAVQIHVSWAPDEDEALSIAHDQWRTNVFSPPLCWDLATVEEFDEAAKHVRPDDVRGSVLVTADLARLADHIERLGELGFGTVYVHHVGQEQARFIDAFGERVLSTTTTATTAVTA